MNLLLDTNVALWWLQDSPRLNASARRSMAAAAEIYVSAVTTWEIAIKQAAGRLGGADDTIETLLAEPFKRIDITAEDGAAAGRLPHHHGDPFDRMLVAQASRRGLTLMTSDRQLADYEVGVLLVR